MGIFFSSRWLLLLLLILTAVLTLSNGRRGGGSRGGGSRGSSSRGSSSSSRRGSSSSSSSSRGSTYERTRDRSSSSSESRYPSPPAPAPNPPAPPPVKSQPAYNPNYKESSSNQGSSGSQPAYNPNYRQPPPYSPRENPPPYSPNQPRGAPPPYSPSAGINSLNWEEKYVLNPHSRFVPGTNTFGIYRPPEPHPMDKLISDHNRRVMERLPKPGDPGYEFLSQYPAESFLLRLPSEVSKENAKKSHISSHSSSSLTAKHSPRKDYSTGSSTRKSTATSSPQPRQDNMKISETGQPGVAQPNAPPPPYQPPAGSIPGANYPRQPGISVGNQPQQGGVPGANYPKQPGISVGSQPQQGGIPGASYPRQPEISVGNQPQQGGVPGANYPKQPGISVGNQPQQGGIPGASYPRQPGVSAGNLPHEGNYPRPPSPNYPQQGGVPGASYPRQPGVSAGNLPHGGNYPRPPSPNYPQQGGIHGANYPRQPGVASGNYPRQPGVIHPQQPLGSNVWQPQSGMPAPAYMNYGGLPTGTNMYSKPHKSKGFLGSLLSMGSHKSGKKNKYYGTYPGPYGAGGMGGMPAAGGLGNFLGKRGSTAAMYTILPYMAAKRSKSLFKPRFGFMPIFLPSPFHHHHYGYGYGHGYGHGYGSYGHTHYDVYNNDYVGRCNRPLTPDHGKVVCNSTHKEVDCDVSCEEGYRFEDNTTNKINKCWHVTGIWKPVKNFPACKPVCTEECLNGGTCASPGKCGCPPDYRGPHCEFHFLKCDIRKLANGVKIKWVCTHTKNETTCRIKCKEPAEFETPPAEKYRCTTEGVWTPDSIPQCILPGTTQESDSTTMEITEKTTVTQEPESQK